MNCCDELAYAVLMKAVVDNNLGPSIRVIDPDSKHPSFVPIKHCPWCAVEFPRNGPVPPVILHRKSV